MPDPTPPTRPQDDNGGYLLHYMDTVAHGDVNLDEECVKVGRVADVGPSALSLP